MSNNRLKVTEEWIERNSRATPVLYLDLDDTVRKGKATVGRFVNKASDVDVFSEVPAILSEYKRNGWRVVAISNQGGVALGLVSNEDCAKAMLETQKQCHGLFDQICYCVHHPEAADPEHAICWCRKPRIGLILTAANALAAKYNEYYPPHLALFVGDLIEDKECAHNAGIKFLWAEEWRMGGWKETVAPTGYLTMQSLNINAAIAVQGADFLTRLLVTKDLKRYQCAVNLASGSTKSWFCTPEDVAREIDAPIDFVMRPDGPTPDQVVMDQMRQLQLETLADGDYPDTLRPQGIPYEPSLDLQDYLEREREVNAGNRG